jgi:hypothetical protein
MPPPALLAFVLGSSPNSAGAIGSGGTSAALLLTTCAAIGADSSKISRRLSKRASRREAGPTSRAASEAASSSPSAPATFERARLLRGVALGVASSGSNMAGASTSAATASAL